MSKQKLPEEELLYNASLEITVLMQSRLEEKEQKIFTEYFVQKAMELLRKNGELFLAAGAHVTKNDEPYSKDMREILEYVEKHTQKKCVFRKGRLLAYFTKGEGTGIWEED